MNTNLLAVLKVIIISGGEGVLDDPALMGQTFAEHCPDEPKAEVLALILCLAAGYHTELRAAAETERAAVKQRLARRLRDDEGMDLALCNATLDLLCAALFGEGAAAETEAAENTQSGFTDVSDAEKEIEILKQIIMEKNKEIESRTGNAKSGLSAAVILGAAAVFISICVGVSRYNNLMTDYNTLAGDFYIKIEQLKNELNENEKIIEPLKKELAQLKTQNADYINKIRILEDGAGNQKIKDAELRRLRQQVKSLQEELAQMQKNPKKKR